VTNHYELLSVASSAPAEEIKRAFRHAIARYHPDKVHHLGKEFQEMAAIRAGQLTEAYRTLMNPELRAEYDRMLDTIQTPPAAMPPPGAGASDAPKTAEPAPSAGSAESRGGRATRYSEDRSSKDQLVRTATLGRIRQILKAEFGTLAEIPVRGFDLVCGTAKSRVFGKSRAVPNLFVRLVEDVDRAVIQETWTMVARAAPSATPDTCVLLLGNISSQREASEAVASLKGQPGQTKVVKLIPIDIRDLSARVPHDLPRVWRTVLDRLRTAT
jgi:DnaJ domain